MSTTKKLRNKLLSKLTELFQLDQPDLDFGFYRIMKAKSQQVKEFIDKDLLQIIEDAFGQIDEIKKTELTQAYEEAVQKAKKYGAPDPEKTEGVKEAKAAFDSLKDNASSEAEVYDHLYRFFERYYDEGDFISRRYYTRENQGKAAPYAIPYNGEEVKLHWANADQYYIKTSEYFSNFSFDITRAKEITDMSEGEKHINSIPDTPLKIHFKIVDASEGEHGNIKESDDKKRFFVLHKNNPVELNENDELVINFEYKPLPGGTNNVSDEIEKELKEKYGKSLNKGAMPNLSIAEKIIEKTAQIEKAKKYSNIMGLFSPTDSIKNRPLIAKYLNQYTARNTMDYFIHKDLGTFLKRELDFYIKNEVINLDDYVPETWDKELNVFETYSQTDKRTLLKIAVIRKIGTKLIEFLAQLEDFQKKLWLKKKFVTETNYCITLDRIPEDLYPEIAANDDQREEWVKLFAIDEIKGDPGELPGMGVPGYSIPLTTEFLKSNDKLVLDTALFDDEFKASLIESIDDFDEHCDGLLIHSENFQALNLLKKQYREKVNYVYIDPPYNTAASEILYKNEYKHSSWLTLIADRILKSHDLIQTNGLISVAIDDYEGYRLQGVLDNILGFENRLGNIVVVHNPGGRHDDRFIATAHEYNFFYGKKISETKTNFLPLEEKDIHSFKHQDEHGAYRTREFRRSGNNSTREARPKMFYPLLVKDNLIQLLKENEYNKLYDNNSKTFDDSYLSDLKRKYENAGFSFLLPIDPNGISRVWRWAPESLKKRLTEVFVEYKNGCYFVKVKDRLDNKLGLKPKSVWYKPQYTAALGTTLLNSIIGQSGKFSYPKGLNTVIDSVRIGTNDDELILDYFAGSGTAGHAVISLNREENGNRKFILIEMAEYFDTVLKPRITKIIYSTTWKDGKPTSRDTGISHCFKYLRLESYEDTLNNLEFNENPVRNRTIEKNPSLRKDYMINYMLDIETRGSQSLLNIDGFSDPTAYTLKVKKPGSDEQVSQNIDLIETFNYLIGLRLTHYGAPKTFTAEFTRNPDPELPEDQHTKLVISGKVKESETGKWWFRKLEGWIPSDPMNPNNGQKNRVLIVWRKLTGNMEEDNLMLDEWFRKYGISTRDFEYDLIYVNGSNNLPNLKKDNENWKVLLIEEEFHKKMWEVE